MAKPTTKPRKGPTLVQRSRRVSPQQKALYHQKTGAGRSKVRRPFLDLTPADEKSIGDLIAAGIQRELDRGQP
jgi:hypothetical protein